MENLISLLQKILESKESKEKEQFIEEFQNIVWNSGNLNEDEWITDVFVNLAHDLEYYVPDDEEIERDSTDYGDERLKEEIEDALRKIKEIKNS